jgi:hypothetical protein
LCGNVNKINNLLATINGFKGVEVEDKWLWSPEEDCEFSVSSIYKVLEDVLFLDGCLNGMEKQVFEFIWRSPTPSKVAAFPWIILLELIPTSTHLFLLCNSVDKV